MPIKSDVVEARVRLPRLVYEWLKEEASRHSASLNSQIVRALVSEKERADRMKSGYSAKPAE